MMGPTRKSRTSAARANRVTAQGRRAMTLEPNSSATSRVTSSAKHPPRLKNLTQPRFGLAKLIGAQGANAPERVARMAPGGRGSVTRKVRLGVGQVGAPLAYGFRA